VSTKLDLLRFLIGKVDILVVAGAMANTFSLPKGGRLAARFASVTWLTVRARPSPWRISGTAVLSCQKAAIGARIGRNVEPQRDYRSRSLHRYRYQCTQGLWDRS
jgi:hypothetical protein